MVSHARRSQWGWLRTAAILCLLAALPGGLRGWFFVRQVQAESKALNYCMSDGLSTWKAILINFSDKHNGRLLTAQERKQLLREFLPEGADRTPGYIILGVSP